MTAIAPERIRSQDTLNRSPEAGRNEYNGLDYSYINNGGDRDGAFASASSAVPLDHDQDQQQQRGARTGRGSGLPPLLNTEPSRHDNVSPQPSPVRGGMSQPMLMMSPSRSNLYGIPTQPGVYGGVNSAYDREDRNTGASTGLDSVVDVNGLRPPPHGTSSTAFDSVFDDETVFYGGNSEEDERLRRLWGVRELCRFISVDCKRIKMFTFTTVPLTMAFKDMLELRLNLGLVAFS